MGAIIFVDVEAGDNCPYSMQQVFSALDDPRPVRQVRLYDRGDKEGVLYDVIGCGEEGFSPAQGVAVEDSGQARAYLVYGGEGGLRFRKSGSAACWDLSDGDQWGESHLLLSDEMDVIWES